MYLINLLTWSAISALVSYVYSVILTDGNMVLNAWYNWLEYKIGDSWLFKPIIGCYKCVAGQFGLWGYFVFVFHSSYNSLLSFQENILLFWGVYDFAFHIVFTSFAIYSVKFIKQAYEWK